MKSVNNGLFLNKFPLPSEIEESSFDKNEEADTTSPPVIPDSHLTSRSVVDYESIPIVVNNTDTTIPVFIEPITLQACSHCDRKFNIDVVGKHEAICSNLNKNRSKFDTIKHRLAGLPVGSHGAPSRKASEPVNEVVQRGRRPSWRDKSDQLRAAIGVARTVDPQERQKFEAELSRVSHDCLTRCDYCGRSFNVDVAARHIPFCKDKASAIPRKMPNSSSKRFIGISATKQQASLRYESQLPLPRGRAPNDPVALPRSMSNQPVVSHAERKQARSPQRIPLTLTKSNVRMRF